MPASFPKKRRLNWLMIVIKNDDSAIGNTAGAGPASAIFIPCKKLMILDDFVLTSMIKAACTANTAIFIWILKQPAKRQ
jgi:hypothetical protein